MPEKPNADSVRDDCIVCGVRTPDHAVGCAAFACRGADAIKAERWRQIQTEGWTPEHDAEHDSGELVLAARCYAEAATSPMPGKPPTNWPWHPSWWKPSADPIRNLEKAGALIAAEIDRRLRAAPNAGSDDA